MKYFFPIIFLLFCGACKEQPTETAKAVNKEFDFATIEGEYSGVFGDNGDIRLFLRHVTEKTVVGFDAHKGLRRNLSGSITAAGNGFALQLNEPGDNPYDGVFELQYDTTLHELKGTWKPVNNKGLSSKTLSLKAVHKGENDEGNYATDYIDSLDNSIIIDPSGIAFYRYYTTDSSSVKAEQYKEVRGNWKKAEHGYIVDWEKNDVFPARQSVFTQPKLEDSSYDEYSIEGEGHLFSTEP